MEQLSTELSRQEKRNKDMVRKDNKSSESSAQPASNWEDSVQELLSGGGAFPTNSAANSALAKAGAPLFDTITNIQYQGNVGILQLSSFGRTPTGGDGNKDTGNEGTNGDGAGDNNNKNPDADRSG